MIGYSRIYNFYCHPIIKLLRLVLFLILGWLIIKNLSGWNLLSTGIKIYTGFFLLFLSLETFFYFKITGYRPKILLNENEGKNIYLSFTLQSLVLIDKDIGTIIKDLLKTEGIKFILQKADIEEKEIIIIPVVKEDLFRYAFELAKNIKGKAVTVLDIFVAYLLFSEDKTRLLFNKKIRKEELLNILDWARVTFAQTVEDGKTYEIKFWGEGIGEDWISGWTLETRKYMQDLRPGISSEKPLNIGREQEYGQIIAALAQNKSVLLIGEPGSGKSSLVEVIASESLLGSIKGKLYHQRFYKLYVDALVAGISNTGDLEERIENIISEVIHSGNVIIFIPQVENILGASTFNIDLSGSILPYLQNRSIRIIATTTPSCYKKFVEPLGSLLDVFENIEIEEPDKNTAFKMLLQKTAVIETRSNIKISYKAMSSALDLANKYLQNRALPGSAVTLLEDVANKASLDGKKIVEERDVINLVEKKTKILLSAPGEREEKLLLNLEEELHKRIVGQNNAVSAIAKGIRRFRSGLANNKKPISFLFLGPTGVGKTATAKALSEIYFGGEKEMIRLDMSEFATEDSSERLLDSGSDDFINKVYNHPFSLILLDEFEKANTKVINLFLQVLDDGILTDSKDRTVSFVNTIIIATSNAGSEFIREEVKNKEAVNDQTFKARLMELLLEKDIFKPELLNRFDDIVVFEPLEGEELIRITDLLLKRFTENMKDKDIIVSYDQKLIGKIIKEGYNEQFGARPLNRFIQDNIEDIVVRKLLNNQIKRGQKINLSVDETNNITLT